MRAPQFGGTNSKILSWGQESTTRAASTDLRKLVCIRLFSAPPLDGDRDKANLPRSR